MLRHAESCALRRAVAAAPPVAAPSAAGLAPSDLGLTAPAPAIEPGLQRAAAAPAPQLPETPPVAAPGIVPAGSERTAAAGPAFAPEQAPQPSAQVKSLETRPCPSYGPYNPSGMASSWCCREGGGLTSCVRHAAGDAASGVPYPICCTGDCQGRGAAAAGRRPGARPRACHVPGRVCAEPAQVGAAGVLCLISELSLMHCEASVPYVGALFSLAAILEEQIAAHLPLWPLLGERWSPAGADCNAAHNRLPLRLPTTPAIISGTTRSTTTSRSSLRSPSGTTALPGRATAPLPRPPQTTITRRPRPCPSRAARAAAPAAAAAVAAAATAPAAAAAQEKARCANPAWLAVQAGCLQGHASVSSSGRSVPHRLPCCSCQ